MRGRFGLWLVLAPVAVVAGTVTYEYDDAGRLKRATFDGTTQVSYGLDAAGNRTALATGALAGTLQFSSASFSATESQSPTNATITVSRTGGSSGAASIRYETYEAGDATDQCTQPMAAGSATAGSDYTNTAGTLNWASGDSANKTFNVPLLVDTLFEGSETVSLRLCNALGGSPGSQSTATLTILDNDAPQPGTLSFSPATYSQSEPFETTALVTVTVTRTGGSNGAVSVTYQTAPGTPNPATAGTDYAHTTGTLNWANGVSSSRTFQVTIYDDTILNEPNETVAISLSSPTGGATIGTGSGNITIVDTDVGVPSTPANLDDNDPGPGPIYSGNYSMHWDDSTGAVSYYELDEDVGGDGSWNATYEVPAPINVKQFDIGQTEQTFKYRVRACNSTDVCSLWSAIKTVHVCGTGTCQ